MESKREERIEDFIRQNRARFDEVPPVDHAERFLSKLNRKLRHIISIVPYLVRVAVATILIFSASVLVWNNFIRKDRNEISLKEKVTLTVHNVLKKLFAEAG